MSKNHLVYSDGNSIQLGSELARGGEGIVYNIQNDLKNLAKIYLKAPDQLKAEKIISMAGASNQHLLKLAAWPLKSIHSPSGNVVGFIMQKLDGYRPLYELYSPKLRLQNFPRADWRFLIHAATNTARAFAAIHESGHVIGDVNHGNLLVANDATVKFIDTDSFQISINRRNWLCEVGVGTYQPPEMQGCKTYKGIVRTPNQDNFGLAVLIFQLLCLARHPFSGRFLGQGEMPIEKAILECRFAYKQDNRITQMAPPPASLPMNALTPQIRLLFEQAFSKEGSKNKGRPDAKQWIFALEELASILKACQKNQGHYYLSSIGASPWCDIESKSNTILFPIINQSRMINFIDLWLQFIEIKDPGPDTLLPDINTICIPPSSFHPSKEALETRTKLKRLKRKMGYLFGLISIITLGASLYYREHVLLMLGPLWGLFGGFIYHFKKKKTLRNITQQITVMKDKWKKLSINCEECAGSKTFRTTRAKLERLKQKYDDLQNEHKFRREELWKNRRQKQLLCHLDRYRIDSNFIGSIGNSRIATLLSHGIETAADIELHRLEKIKGFGQKLIKRLMDWRENCEKFFVIDFAKDIPMSDIHIIEMDIAAKTRKLELELSDGIISLNELSNQIQERRKQIYSEATFIFNTYAQLLSDARAMGLNQ